MIRHWGFCWCQISLQVLYVSEENFFLKVSQLVRPKLFKCSSISLQVVYSIPHMPDANISAILTCEKVITGPDFITFVRENEALIKVFWAQRNSFLPHKFLHKLYTPDEMSKMCKTHPELWSYKNSYRFVPAPTLAQVRKYLATFSTAIGDDVTHHSMIRVILDYLCHVFKQLHSIEALSK